MVLFLPLPLQNILPPTALRRATLLLLACSAGAAAAAASVSPRPETAHPRPEKSWQYSYRGETGALPGATQLAPAREHAHAPARAVATSRVMLALAAQLEAAYENARGCAVGAHRKLSPQQPRAALAGSCANTMRPTRPAADAGREKTRGGGGRVVAAALASAASGVGQEGVKRRIHELQLELGILLDKTDKTKMHHPIKVSLRTNDGWLTTTYLPDKLHGHPFI